MAKKRESGLIITADRSGKTDHTIENVLAGLTLGIGIFKITEKETTPLFFSESLKKLSGLHDGVPINVKALFPGQLYLDRNELRSKIFAGNSVEFIAQMSGSDGSTFTARIVISPRDLPEYIFNVALFNVENNILLYTEPKIKARPTYKDGHSVESEFIHSWHDRRYRLLLEDSTVFTFEYDCETDLYTYYGIDENGGIFIKETKHYIKNLKLHKKSKLDPNIVISQNIEEMLAAPTVREFDVHSHDDDTGYRWYSCKSKSVAGADGRVRRVVGWLNDITDKQKEHAKLTAMAEKDGLTGAFNRAAMERYFEEYFAGKNEREGMLFFIDFDKFKYINDTYGHLAGDEVLKESTKAIQSVLDQGDLFCRYGGDEFVVFIDKFSDIDAAEIRAKQMIDAVGSVVVRGEIMPKCSVGFTEIWDTDKSGHDTIKRADTALLHAKKVAACSYVYYGKRGVGSAMVVKRVDKDKTVVVEKESLHDNDFFAEMFYLMFSAKSENEGLDRLLEHVGKRFGISRAYIFEMLDESRARNTHEWCNKGVTPVKATLQDVDIVMDGQKYTDIFNSDGVFYCNSISELGPEKRAKLEAHGIKVTLQYLVIDGGKLLGMIGYDDCVSSADWTDEQREGLIFVSKLAAIFLSKSFHKKKICPVPAKPQKKENI